MRVGDEQEIELGDLLEDSGNQPEDLIIQSCLSTDLESLLANLTSQQREVLTLVWLMDNFDTGKIGVRLNLSWRESAPGRKSGTETATSISKVAEKLIDYWQ